MTNIHSYFGIFVCFIIIRRISVSAQPLGDSEIEILDSIFKNYSNMVRPIQKGSFPRHLPYPTVVHVNTYIRSIESICEVKREFSVQLTLRLEWKDDRLAYNNGKFRKGYLKLRDLKIIWIPDLFFRNEKKGFFHIVMNKNEFVRIFPSGNILFSMRLSLTLSCPMQLRNFPFDTQNCSISMASYGLTTDDIIYKWKDDNPIQVSNTLDLLNFALKKYETDSCDTQTTTGLYSCIRLDFFFRRQFYYYFVQIFIPCTSLVIVAWLSFWLDPKDIIARLIITVLVHVIMIIGCGLLNFNLPKTTYTKAIDIWTGICLTFVFAALVETILVNFLVTKSKPEISGVGVVNDAASDCQESFRHKNLSKKLDILSRILYPALFILFVGVYFGVYC